MSRILRYLILSSLFFSPMAAISATCQQTDDDEKFACDIFENIKKNADDVRGEAVNLMPDNSALKSLNTLYDLQLKNCNNFKCRNDASSKYFMVVKNAISLKPSPINKKLTLEQACEAATYMRYYSALFAFSADGDANLAEANAKRFGKEILVDDIDPYVKSYLSPYSLPFRQAYLQGETAMSSMFMPMVGNCKSDPASHIPSLAILVRSDGIEFDELIKAYQR